MDILLINHCSSSLPHGMEFRPGYLRGDGANSAMAADATVSIWPKGPYLEAHRMARDKLPIAPNSIDPAEFTW